MKQAVHSLNIFPPDLEDQGQYLFVSFHYTPGKRATYNDPPESPEIDLLEVWVMWEDPSGPRRLADQAVVDQYYDFICNKIVDQSPYE